MDRHHFIRVIGGSSSSAATVVSQSGCSALSSGFPPAAVEAWQGPSAGDTDPRRRALAYAITAPNPCRCFAGWATRRVLHQQRLGGRLINLL